MALPEIIVSNMDTAYQRYERAKEALIKAGVNNFVELVEKNDPVAIEYIKALADLPEAQDRKEEKV